MYPKVKNVIAIDGRRLFVTFIDGTKKTYDCTALLKENPFTALQNEQLFKSVKADKHGYGISWSDELDLSESELWIHGLSNEA